MRVIANKNVPLHEDALSWAATSGLSVASSQVRRLSGFLLEVERHGVVLSWLVLGRSEFNSRDGATYRSVIGPNGNVVGTVVDAETGMVLDGSSRVDFPNPIKSAAVTDLYVFAHHGSEAASIPSAASLINAYVSASDPGFDIAIGGAIGLGASPDTAAAYLSYGVGAAVATRSSVFRQHLPATKKMSGLVYSGSDPGAITTPRPGQSPGTKTMLIAKDLWNLTSNTTSPTAYNDGVTWSVGSWPGGANPYTGEIDILLAGNHPLSPAQRDTLHGAMLRHGLIQAEKMMMLIAVGDSMTDGQAGSVPLPLTRTAQICYNIPSGWQGCLYSQNAWSGQPIEIQEQLYAQSAARFDRFADSVDKWVMFWGGYNATAPGEDDAAQDALIDRYMAMSADAETRGVRSIHWSYLVGYNGTPKDPADQARYTRFVNEFRDRCAADGHLYYDHRLTFDQGEFDGETRNPDFFVDTRHLSALGQETLSKDFVARFPGPDQEWDADAANYIARIVQKGANPTTAQRQTINDWYLAEKAAGTYADLKMVYLPVWGIADANRVNMITGQMDATVVDDVIHGAGVVQSDAGGTPGHYRLGQTPVQLGMTTSSTYYASLIMEAMGASAAAIGARNGGSRQQLLGTTSSSWPYFSSGAVSVTKPTVGIAGILSGSRRPGEIFLAERTAGGRTKVATNATSAGGQVSDQEIFALSRNINGVASGLHGMPCGFWVAGLGKEDSEDERFTLGMKNLWEGVTGLVIP